MTATATATAAPTRARVAPRPTPRSTPTAARAREARRPELRVVSPPPRRYPARAVVLVAGVVVFAAMLVSAMFHSVLVSGQDRIDDLGRQITLERKGLAQDRLELAGLSSPERIATEAERLGLVFAERQTWIRPGEGNAPVVTGGDADGEGEGGSERSTATDGSDGGGGEELAAARTTRVDRRDGARR